MMRDGITIDAIVRKIGGSKGRREANLEIRGSSNYTNRRIKWGDDPIILAEDLSIAIDTGIKAGSRNVYINVIGPDYRTEWRNYPVGARRIH